MLGHLFFPPVILRMSQTTDLCLAQERVGQLDLGVVRNIKVLARLGQSDVQLLLETGSGRGKRTRAGGGVGWGGEEEKRRLWDFNLSFDVRMYGESARPRAANWMCLCVCVCVIGKVSDKRRPEEVGQV